MVLFTSLVLEQLFTAKAYNVVSILCTVHIGKT